MADECSRFKMEIPDEIVERYPSLRKVKEQGENYVEWNDGREQVLLDCIRTHKSKDTFRNNPQAKLAAMDDFSNERDFLISIGPHKDGIVTELIAKTKPRMLVELGGYVGYSAILFADAIRTAAAAAAQQEHAHKLELWSLTFDERFAKIARELVDLAGLRSIVHIDVGSAEESLRRLKAEGKMGSGDVDFLFLGHVESLYERDLSVAWEELGLLRSGSYIVADNVLVPGAPEYRAFVRSRCGLLQSRAVKGLIMPGEKEDKLEITKVL